MRTAFVIAVATMGLFSAIGGATAPASPLVVLAQAQPVEARTIVAFRKALVSVFDRNGSQRGSVTAGELQPLVGATVTRNSQAHFGLNLPGGDYYFSLPDLSLSGATGRTAHQICPAVRPDKTKSGSSGLGSLCSPP